MLGFCRHTTGQQEQRIRQLDDRKAAQVLRVDDMAGDAEGAEGDWEAVDEEEKRLYANDAVDEAVEQFLREDGVFLDKLGEVVKPGSCYTG